MRRCLVGLSLARCRRRYSVAVELFRRMDSDRNGVCTLEEVEEFLQEYPNIEEAAVDVVRRWRQTSSRRYATKAVLRLTDVGHASAGKGEKNDDAFFVSKTTNTLCVADGVGGWGRYGVDSSQYSKQFTETARRLLDSGSMSSISSPRQVMEIAFERTRVVGSAAVCIAGIRGANLQVANVGDTQCTIVRGGRVVMATDAQMHSPEKPFQLGLQCGDSPADAETTSYSLRARDTVVLTTDGISGNMAEGEMLECLQNGLGAQEIAERVVQTAYKKSQGPGGHIDDITCVVGVVGSV